MAAKRRSWKVLSPARGSRGATLLETVLAIVIMATAGLAIVALLQQATLASFKARERMTCASMADTGMARLKNIDFFYLFAVDSSSSNWATPPLHASYPYSSVLTGIKTSLAASNFDRYRVDVVFMRRDSSDALGTGNVSNLIPFKNNGAGVDAYDPNVKFFDQDGDGDYYETYPVNGQTVAEQPDTHLKKVAFNVFRRGRLACSKTELISLEQFTGASKPDSEAVLIIEISTPSNSSYAYQMQTAAQIGAHNMAITNLYPAGIPQYRADAGSPMPVSGQTDPLATVNLYVGASGNVANAVSDALGSFAASPAAVTSLLVEGQNILRGQAVKSTFISPWANRSLILDVDPPTVSGQVPTGTVNTYQPYVAATIQDPTVSTSAAASGICPAVIAMKVNGSTVNFTYNSLSGTVVWIDSTTQNSPIVSSGTYTISVEGGDFAGYKTSATWTFTVSVPSTDNSAPSISNKDPIGGAAVSDLPVVSVRVFDNQSGIDPSSILMTLDGAAVVPSYDPNSGSVSYIPPASFAAGSFHTVTISVNHWAMNPSNKVTSTDSWAFSVP
jgi:type II secretory pathway pseudopilin PulG